jgi:hypothetical protein
MVYIVRVVGAKTTQKSPVKFTGDFTIKNIWDSVKKHIGFCDKTIWSYWNFEKFNLYLALC